MNARYILLTAMLATEALAADSAIAPRVTVPGTPIYIQRTNSVDILHTNFYVHRTDSVYIQHTNAAPSSIGISGFRLQLVQFAVSPPSGSPTRYIVSGKVTDNNAGAPVERAVILFSSPSHSLRLAALTDADGEFKFRIWLKEDKRESPLQTPKLDEGVLYVLSSQYSSQFDGFPDKDPRLGDMTAYAYSFRELLARAPASQPSQTK